MDNKNPKFTGLGVYFHEHPNLVLTDSEFRYHNDVNPVFEYVDLQKDGSEKKLTKQVVDYLLHNYWIPHSYDSIYLSGGRYET